MKSRREDSSVLVIPEDHNSAEVYAVLMWMVIFLEKKYFLALYLYLGHSLKFYPPLIWTKKIQIISGFQNYISEPFEYIRLR